MPLYALQAHVVEEDGGNLTRNALRLPLFTPSFTDVGASSYAVGLGCAVFLWRHIYVLSYNLLPRLSAVGILP